MDKILKLKGCRCGSVWILLFACFLLWAGLPVHAANAASASAVLPVSQEMTITNGENETVSEDITYCLTAKDSDTPMPEGSEGSVYTFVLHGTQTVNCGPIVYGHAGVYH